MLTKPSNWMQIHFQCWPQDPHSFWCTLSPTLTIECNDTRGCVGVVMLLSNTKTAVCVLWWSKQQISTMLRHKLPGNLPSMLDCLCLIGQCSLLLDEANANFLLHYPVFSSSSLNTALSLRWVMSVFLLQAIVDVKPLKLAIRSLGLPEVMSLLSEHEIVW